MRSDQSALRLIVGRCKPEILPSLLVVSVESVVVSAVRVVGADRLRVDARRMTALPSGFQ